MTDLRARQRHSTCELSGQSVWSWMLERGLTEASERLPSVKRRRALKEFRPLLPDGGVEGSPGDLEMVLDRLPITVRDSARGFPAVADFHRLGALPGVLHQASRRHAIELRRRIGERPCE